MLLTYLIFSLFKTCKPCRQYAIISNASENVELHVDMRSYESSQGLALQKLAIVLLGHNGREKGAMEAIYKMSHRWLCNTWGPKKRLLSKKVYVVGKHFRIRPCNSQGFCTVWMHVSVIFHHPPRCQLNDKQGLLSMWGCDKTNDFSLWSPPIQQSALAIDADAAVGDWSSWDVLRTTIVHGWQVINITFSL